MVSCRPPTHKLILRMHWPTCVCCYLPYQQCRHPPHNHLAPHTLLPLILFLVTFEALQGERSVRGC